MCKANKTQTKAMRLFLLSSPPPPHLFAPCRKHRERNLLSCCPWRREWVLIHITIDFNPFAVEFTDAYRTLSSGCAINIPSMSTAKKRPFCSLVHNLRQFWGLNCLLPQQVTLLSFLPTVNSLTKARVISHLCSHIHASALLTQLLLKNHHCALWHMGT